MSIFQKTKQSLIDIWSVFALELRRIFTDSGVIVLFFVAGLLYPIMYNFIYKDELILNVPVAIVDDAHCDESRAFARKIDATPEMNVRYKCSSMEEAKTLMKQRKINGIIYFPSDYGTHLAKLEQATVAIYCDMSTFFYYKSVLTGTNMVMLDEMKNIQLKRYSMKGITGERADELITPVQYNDVKLFLPGGGYASFLLPALIILVIHQTLFFGIGMLGGTAREDKLEVELMPAHLRFRSVHRVVWGRTLAYLTVYVLILAIDLLLVPFLFGLPQEGNIGDLILFLLPFLLATIFFSITFASLLRHRETGLLTMSFFSVILLFISGIVWPTSSEPLVWRLLGYVFPSTHGIQGYIKIGTLGASLKEVRFEYIALAIQTVFYFITATWSLRYINRYRPIENKINERREYLLQNLSDRRETIREQRQQNARK